MHWSALWSGAGRAVNNIGAGIVGIISYMLIDSPGIMVTAVKKDGEVGLEYMKSVEIEKRIRQESREEERKTN